MPTTPLITTIINALDTRLDAIAAGSTYNTTPTIAQYRAAPFAVAETPAINIRVLGALQPRDGLVGKWDHMARVALDIAAKTAAEFHNTLVDVLIALDTDLTLSGNVIDIKYMGYELVFDQEKKIIVGGTPIFEVIYRTDDMKI